MRHPGAKRRRAASLAGAALVVLTPFAVLQSSSADPAGPRLVGPTSTEVKHVPTADDALGGVLGGELAAASARAEDPEYPGLPVRTGSQWDGVGSTGITTIPRSQQVVRLPPLAVAADVTAKLAPPPPGYTSNVVTSLNGYVLSPPGADHLYGDFPKLGVRTLAFGSLPVTATVVISQLRDEDDLPVALTGGQPNPFNFSNGTSYFADGSLAGQVTLRLTDVAVDNVPVDVGPSCRTATPTTLSLVGRGYFRRGDVYWQLPDPEPTPATRLTEQQVARDYYTIASGGLLTGTLDVPEFTGCSGPAGDLSTLISSAVSGDGQPVKVRQSTTFNCFPTDKVTECTIPDEFPYPDPPKD